MSSNTSASRIEEIKHGDVYFSPPRLVAILKNVIEDTIKDESIVLYDPSAADGRLLRPFETSRPTFNGDIKPLRNHVEKRDFIKNPMRPKLAQTRPLALVFNPPFSLTTSKNGVAAFLEKAETIMRDGEYAIVIAPHTVSNVNNLLKIPKALHLKKEYIIRGGIIFTKPQLAKGDNSCNTKDDCKSRCKTKKCNTEANCVNNECVEKKSINTIIQVWRKDAHAPFLPGITSKTFTVKDESSLPFTASTSQGSETKVPDFFILRKASGKDVGMVLDHADLKILLEDTYGRKDRKARKTCRSLCNAPSGSDEKTRRKCGLKKTEGDCSKPCNWVELCSMYTTKTVSYAEKAAASLVPIFVKDGFNVEKIKRQFHEVFTRDVYTRFLGYHTEQGGQTISPKFISYAYMNHRFIPTREALGITTEVVGTKAQVKQFEKRMGDVAKLNEMYDKKWLTGGMKNAIRSHENFIGRRDVMLRRHANRKIINSKP